MILNDILEGSKYVSDNSKYISINYDVLDVIKKVLEFYVSANKLKTTIIDDVNNYSVADHLFGSMILAISFDSEFRETENLGKVLRMLIIDEFSKLNQNYQLNNLRLGEQFENELVEVLSCQTNESKLVFKYRMLDFSLTKLIIEKQNKVTYLELVQEARKILSFAGNVSFQKCDEIFRFYYLNFRLKNKMRSGWDQSHWNVKSNRIERISEHVIGTMALALIMKSEFSYDFDLDRALITLAIHETGETLIGDITPFDDITPNEKKEIEHKAMKDALGNLSNKNRLLQMLLEFDDQKTNESEFSYLCDKIEADLQSKIYQDMGLHRSLDDQANNCAFKSSKVQKMVQEGATTAFDIWYEWDKGIYEEDEIYPEFYSILNVARDNNLLNLTNDVVKEKNYILKKNKI